MEKAHKDLTGKENDEEDLMGWICPESLPEVIYDGSVGKLTQYCVCLYPLENVIGTKSPNIIVLPIPLVDISINGSGLA